MTTKVKIATEQLHGGKHVVVTVHHHGSDVINASKTEVARHTEDGHTWEGYVHNGAHLTVHEEDAQEPHHKGPHGA